MWVPVIILTAFSVWVSIFASLAAVVLNLPYPIGVRILLLAAGMWCYWVLCALDRIKDAVVKQAYWSRLTFITTQIRNDADNLQPALDRLADDLATERGIKELGGGDWTLFFSISGFLIFLMAVAVVLHFGWLGEFGNGRFFDPHSDILQRWPKN